MALQDCHALGSLAAASLHQQMSIWCEPAGRARCDPTLYVEPVRTSVEREPRLVQTRFWRHERDRICRDIRRVGEQHVDLTGQQGWQRFIEVALTYLSSGC